jgi:hexokinase
MQSVVVHAVQAWQFVRSHFFEENELVPTKTSSIHPNVDAVLRDYIHGQSTYAKVRDLLDVEMNRGLSKTGNATASVKMFVTYVQSLPDGTESGNYLALDLGGTNFRVLLISLKGAKVEMKNKIYPISDELMLGTGDQLFDHIASCIASFLHDHELHGQSLPLGFTFSFPCRQEGLAVGRLVRWTKGFRCDGVEGEDVVALLHAAIKRRNDIDVECVALLNDTVGCLMSCAFLDHNTEVGVILGTGTNACYLEKLDRVQLWDGDNAEPQQVIINTEWGAFGDNGVLDFVRTQADRDIDSESLNPGKQLYEKMISGMYMGEIARRVIVQCVREGLLFDGELSEELDTPHKFYTKYISEIEKDEDGGEFLQTKEILDEVGYSNPSIEDCQNVRKICKAVSERAAYLASAGIAALLNRINKQCVTVAVDGSLYRFHPHFHSLMMTMTKSLVKKGINFRMMLSEDGSGKGAALVAAVAYRLQQKRRSVSNS